MAEKPETTRYREDLNLRTGRHEDFDPISNSLTNVGWSARIARTDFDGDSPELLLEEPVKT